MSVTTMSHVIPLLDELNHAETGEPLQQPTWDGHKMVDPYEIQWNDNQDLDPVMDEFDRLQMASAWTEQDKRQGDIGVLQHDSLEQYQAKVTTWEPSGGMDHDGVSCPHACYTSYQAILYLISCHVHLSVCDDPVSCLPVLICDNAVSCPSVPTHIACYRWLVLKNYGIVICKI